MSSCALWISVRRVLLSDVDIGETTVRKSWEKTSVVLQDPFLYHGTIKVQYRHVKILVRSPGLRLPLWMQIRYSGPSAGLWCTCVWAWFESFSTGQRQLLAFARVVASQPKILILDEATVILTRRQAVQDSLAKKMRKGRTTVSLSSFNYSRCQLYLRFGQRAHHWEWNPWELLDLGGTYHKMYSLQAGALA